MSGRNFGVTNDHQYLSDVAPNQHHPQLHVLTHQSGGNDVLYLPCKNGSNTYNVPYDCVFSYIPIFHNIYTEAAYTQTGTFEVPLYRQLATFSTNTPTFYILLQTSNSSGTAYANLYIDHTLINTFSTTSATPVILSYQYNSTNLTTGVHQVVLTGYNSGDYTTTVTMFAGDVITQVLTPPANGSTTSTTWATIESYNFTNSAIIYNCTGQIKASILGGEAGFQVNVNNGGAGTHSASTTDNWWVNFALSGFAMGLVSSLTLQAESTSGNTAYYQNIVLSVGTIDFKQLY